MFSVPLSIRSTFNNNFERKKKTNYNEAYLSVYFFDNHFISVEHDIDRNVLRANINFPFFSHP